MPTSKDESKKKVRYREDLSNDNPDLKRLDKIIDKYTDDGSLTISSNLKKDKVSISK